jgi:predicted short-subunit dehydrogenase-like oxidoreductase (DUF2520 family)
VVARSRTARSNISGISGIPVYHSVDVIEFLPESVAITVGDNAITATNARLAANFGDQLAGKYLFHCSGSKRATELGQCIARGAKCASLHPYQTFYESGPETLRGITWGVECPDNDFPVFSRIIESIGGLPEQLSDETLRRKTLYHASAVAASNFMTTIIQLSKEMAARAGIDPKAFQPPIIQTTMANNEKYMGKTEQFPLTGPVARGDAETIRNHAESIRGDRPLLEAYCHMSIATAGLARHYNMLSEEKYRRITRILSSYISENK